MIWSVADERFQENLEAAKAYYDQRWTLCAPRTASALDRPVGQWISNLRRPGALPALVVTDVVRKRLCPSHMALVLGDFRVRSQQVGQCLTSSGLDDSVGNVAHGGR